MSEIVDNGEFWKLIINPDIKHKENIDELKTKGFTARLGEDADGNFLVMDVNYAKSKFTLDNIFKFAEQGASCSRCDTLNKERMKLSKVTLKQAEVSDPVPSTPQNNSLSFNSPYGITSPNELKKPGAFKEILSDTIFNAVFTDPGKFFFAAMMGDSDMMDKVIPKTSEGLDTFMDDLMGFFSGDVEFLRNPEDTKEYFSAMRRPKDEDNDVPTRSLKRTKKTLPFNGTVVY